MTSDYYLTICKIDGKYSLLCIDASLNGIKKTKLTITGWKAQNTTLLAFDDVKVPSHCLIGEIGKGFYYIMENFLEERLFMAVSTLQLSKICYNESCDYAKKRIAFKKKLIDNQVIQHKLMNMAAKIVQQESYVYSIAYESDQLDLYKNKNSNEYKKFKASYIAKNALAKYLGSQMLEYISRESAQIFGGNSYVEGYEVERIARVVRVQAVGGK